MKLEELILQVDLTTYKNVTYNSNHPRNLERNELEGYSDKPAHGVVSEIMVCQSNAGYYIGSLQFDSEVNHWFPYSRDSEDYYPDERTAQSALDNDTWVLRCYA
jgi:hypothetical protein|tara:strand:+ start:1142 stop:1453 length:312 start_codon:yes stop_codon:yes gene_type:complete